MHVAVTHFNFISVENLVKGVFFEKWLSIGCKKDWPILVVTLLLYGGLNHIMYDWQFMVLVFLVTYIWGVIK